MQLPRGETDKLMDHTRTKVIPKPSSTNTPSLDSIKQVWRYGFKTDREVKAIHDDPVRPPTVQSRTAVISWRRAHRTQTAEAAASLRSRPSAGPPTVRCRPDTTSRLDRDLVRKILTRPLICVLVAHGPTDGGLDIGVERGNLSPSLRPSMILVRTLQADLDASPICSPCVTLTVCV